jgi:Lon protease-like protein
MASELPIFPLSSVLFPHMPLPLRIFEDRYLIMLSRILQEEPSEFGQVLIERGQESGGGESRFAIGTIARVTDLQGGEGFVSMTTRGARRFEVEEWLDDDPYPRGMVRYLDDLDWEPELTATLERTEQIVRRVLAEAAEYSDQVWPSSVELSDIPVELAWQLAAIAPLNPIDQVDLLRSTSLRRLLDTTAEHTLAVEAMLGSGWTGEL